MAWTFRKPKQQKPQQPWREQVRARAATLDELASRMGDPTRQAIQGFLESAVGATRGNSYLPWARRARLERAFGQLDAAEAALLSRAGDTYLLGLLPAVMNHVAAHLPTSNAERLWVEQLAKVPPNPLTNEHRTGLTSAFTAASAAARREQSRLRSFRNIVFITFLALTVLAVWLVRVGETKPPWIPLCFAPQTLGKVVCPTQETALPPTAGGTGSGTGDEAGEAPATATATTNTTPTTETETEAAGGDESGTATATGGESPEASATGTAAPTGAVASQGTELDDVVDRTAQPHDLRVVMLLGLAGAAVTGAATLRRMRGTSTPYMILVALILLKLPTGALTAVLGLVLLSAGFVPGFSALDSSAQILGWAVVFGASQQLVTGLVDKKAQSVLDSVGSAPMTADKE
jgi:hypothetical protein